MERFASQVALVSGAGAGIGRAVAHRLASEGATVACLDLAHDKADETAASLQGAIAIDGDIADAGACGRAVAATVDQFGQLDVLVNAAGIAASHRITTFPEADWRRIIEVNLTGTFLLSQAAVAALVVRRGAIVNLASVAGLRATPYNAAYCASKGGVVMLTKSMAVELAREGVRVNAVCPSAVDTDLLRGFSLPDDADMQLLGRAASPMGKILEPTEVAAAVAYLASNEAASITGTVLTIDGGATA